MLVRLLRKERAAFEPEAVQAMTTAYNRLRETLRLSSLDDPLTEVVADHVIQVARRGERNPSRIYDLVLAKIRL